MIFGRRSFVTSAPVSGTDSRHDIDSAARRVFIVLIQLRVFSSRLVCPGRETGTQHGFIVSIQSCIFSCLWKAAFPTGIELI